jgi:predicted DNA-binding transcriptional regulator AlpA
MRPYAHQNDEVQMMSSRADLLNSTADVQPPPPPASGATNQPPPDPTPSPIAAAKPAANPSARPARPRARSDTSGEDGEQSGDADPAAVISVAATARLLNIHAATLRRWWARDLFPRPKRLGPNRIGFKRSDIDAWLASRPVVSTPCEAA